MNIIIRDVNDAAVARIDQLAKKKKMSRQVYLKKYLETLSVIEDMKELDMKYASLVKEMAETINKNTRELNEVKKVLEKFQLSQID